MANTNSPFGFKPIRRLDGAAWSSNHTTKKMQITAGALNRGDVVKQLADGTVAVSTVAAGAANLGVFVGCHYLLASLGYPIWSNYWPGAGATAGTLVDAFIIDDPLVVYEVMASTGPITAANVGENADFVVTASTTGFSKWALATPAVAAGSDVLPFKVVGVGNAGVNIQDGLDVASANNIVEVAWNVQNYKTVSLNA
jgi:hypothetical protein